MKVTIIIILTFNILTLAEEWIYFNKSNTPLISNRVVAVAESRLNEYYIATSNNSSFFRYIPTTGWTRLDTSGSIFKDEYISILYKDKFERLWAIGSNIIWLDDEKWNRIETEIDVSCIAVEDENLIWFGTFSGGLYKYDFNTFSKIESPLLQYEINTIAIDDNKNKWIGMDNGGELVKLKDGNIEKISHPSFLTSQIPVYSVNSLAFDKDGFLWITANVISSDLGGSSPVYNYAKYNPGNNEWALFGNSEIGIYTIPGKRSFHIDKVNNKWDGTNDGLMLFDNNNFQFLNSGNSGVKFDAVWDVFIDSYANKWMFGYPANGIAIYNMIGVKNITGVNETRKPIFNYELKQNYPNPFNSATIINYRVPSFAAAGAYSLVTLKVYNILGNEVATLVNEQKTGGEYEIGFYADNLPSNVYFYTLTVGENRITKKMVLLK